MIRAAFAIALVPVLALLSLVWLGHADPWLSLAAAVATCLAALGLAAAWADDLRDLTDELHRIGTGERAGPGAAQAKLTLPPSVMAEAALLAQAFAERGQLAERLRRSEESILERLPDPLMLLGADRGLRRANEAARTAFGAEMSAVLRHPELRAAIDRALAGGPEAMPQTADLRLPVPVPREVQAMVAGLESPLAGGAGVLVVLSDRTRERAIERTRVDFVANASHELRTPLASLIGFIDTLRGPAHDDPPARARFLEIMAEQASRMNRLIDDLLSLSRIELVEHQPPAEAVDMVDLVERMLASFEIRLAQRGTRVEWSPPANLPNVPGDTDQLEQVLQNLLDNAVKYGKQNGTIRVGLAQADPETAPRGGAVPGATAWPPRPGVVLWVEDDGAGISAQHLPRLTERFYRVDDGRSRAVGGTGLGLAIVKHVVNRHRGQLLVESAKDRGAKFSVWLPTGG